MFATHRKWTSGAGMAAAPSTGASPSATRLPATGVPAGAFRGRGFGERFGKTERTDNWWAVPLSQAIGLALLGAYATWAAFQGNHYEFGNYLSPFYLPLFKPTW